MSHTPTPAGVCGGCPLAPADAGPADPGRRAFLSQAALAAAYATAAAALAACGAGGDGPTSPGSITPTALSVASYASLGAVGGVTTLTISGVPIVVVRTGASSFLALSRVCPHQGTTVNVVSGGFYCPNHGAQFNTTGTWTGGQRASNLTSYPTSYDATTGTLTIG
ncbi:hypothetical protein tb265_46530 [Gemmatimonadetes bacterium T265]|nr:hypothetical protein tb265_46530 [Gemmatimonadetes bacterium T265]